MKLTVFTDYSLRVLMYLATQPGKKAKIADMAEAFDVSLNHLVKVAHFLGKKGWISTSRGKGGGVELARPAQEIGIGQVVRDTEGLLAPAECFEPEGGSCAIKSCCQLKNILNQAVQSFYATLDQFTLADVTQNREELSQALIFFRSPGAAASATDNSAGADKQDSDATVIC